MLRTVFDAFALYRPLSYTMHNLAYEGDYTISIGEWIRIKDKWSQRGSYIQSHRQFYELICKYGEAMSQYVRRPIKDEFTRLVQLVKQLKPYNRMEYSKDINKIVHILNDYDVTKITEYRATKVVINTDNPDIVTIRVDTHTDPIRILHVGRLDTIYIIEVIIDDLIPLYKQAARDVTAIKEHNDRILEEIKRLVLPRRISNGLDASATS